MLQMLPLGKLISRNARRCDICASFSSMRQQPTTFEYLQYGPFRSRGPAEDRCHLLVSLRQWPALLCLLVDYIPGSQRKTPLAGSSRRRRILRRAFKTPSIVWHWLPQVPSHTKFALIERDSLQYPITWAAQGPLAPTATMLSHDRVN